MSLPLRPLVCALALLMAHPATPLAQSDLDDLMAAVLARRDENWKKLQQYVLDEREEIALTGPGGARLWGEQRDYTWYIRDGFFVRSPVRANGAGVSEEARLKYEDEFLRRARARDVAARNAASARPDPGAASPSASPGPEAPSPLPSPEPQVSSLLMQTRQPQFIDSAYFLRFKFEPGRYALVGRERVSGRDALRVEYYPERLFSHEQDAERQRRREQRADRREDVEAATERSLNKVALVTLWVDPAARQILKYTFDNVDFDFLPAAWLLRVDDMTATMTMAQPSPEVWLPSHVDVGVGFVTAAGPFALRYQIDYRNYQEATTTGRVK